AVRAAGGADLARAGQLQTQTRLDACRDVDRHGPARAHATLALACGARVGDDGAVSLAAAARLRRHHVAQQAPYGALHMPRAAADVARHRLRAGLTARPLAGLAQHGGVDLQIAVRAE